MLQSDGLREWGIGGEGDRKSVSQGLKRDVFSLSFLLSRSISVPLSPVSLCMCLLQERKDRSGEGRMDDMAGAVERTELEMSACICYLLSNCVSPVKRLLFCLCVCTVQHVLLMSMCT